MTETKPGKPHVLILGGGFGGLTAAKLLARTGADITLVDRQNHHLFQPLLYQVATAGLSAPDIAEPIRSILRDYPNVSTRMNTVTEIQLNEKKVRFAAGESGYDYLILALGGVTSYFGHPEWEPVAPGLKSLEDAQRIRREVLLAFERAEIESDDAKRRRLLTIVVVGGGPTGVELAGAFAELARFALRGDFRHINPGQTRIILIEASERVLSHLPADLGDETRRKLEELGVEVRTQVKVQNITRGRVELTTGEIIEAENIIWAAGVGASPLTKQLGVELDRAGRVKVLPDLSVPGHPEVFAIGDMALVAGRDGRPTPGVSPAAMQMAQHAARLIRREMESGPQPAEKRPAFVYWDKGTMATIGRSAAVAMIGRLKLKGFPAWLSWLGVHLIFLIGFRNKAIVLFQWAWSYFTYGRGARIIVGESAGRQGAGPDERREAAPPPSQ